MPRILTFFLIALAASAKTHWVASWGAAPDQACPPLAPSTTIRQVVRLSLGGSAVRLRVSNLYGEAPLTLRSVRIARHTPGSSTSTATNRKVTFSGRTTIIVPKGSSALSDTVNLPVHALEELAVSTYLPDGSTAPTCHGVGNTTAWFVSGDQTGVMSLAGAKADNSRWFLTDMEVAASPKARLVVAVGDSITDGVGSTEDANRRWPDLLAERFQSEPALRDVAVVNSGIAGNRLLNDASAPFVGPSLLNRFDRDVLDKAGIRWIVVLSGSNDVTASGVLKDPKDQVSADQIIAGYLELISRAHTRGLKIYAATFLPSGGVTTGRFVLSAENQTKRAMVNAWIRDSGAFDGVIDFEAHLRDPAQPGRMRDVYDSGDHVHPNDTGYRVMASAISLGLFRD